MIFVTWSKDPRITRMLIDGGVSVAKLIILMRTLRTVQIHLERLLRLSPNIEHEIISEPVVGRGKAVLIRISESADLYKQFSICRNSKTVISQLQKRN